MTTRQNRASSRRQGNSSAIAVEECSDDLLAVRMAIRRYLLDSSEIVDSAYFFLLQGVGNKSLCIHTNLSAEMYAALLIVAKLVKTRVSGDNATMVSLNFDGWKDFLS